MFSCFVVFTNCLLVNSYIVLSISLSLVAISVSVDQDETAQNVKSDHLSTMSGTLSFRTQDENNFESVSILVLF